MKKLLLAAFLICSSLSAFSQSESKFNPGLRFNPSFSWLKIESDSSYMQASNDGVRLGFSYGIMADYMFKPNYGLSFELRFDQVNGRYKVTDPASHTTTEKIRLQYVQLPVSLKMKTNEVGYIKYFGQFGFIPSVNIRARADIEKETGGSTLTSQNVNILKEINLFNIYMMIGGGLEYNLGGSTSILAGLTFENGFMNVLNKKEYAKNYFYTLDARSKIISLNLGVLF